jgi:hypothetical protein
VKGRENYERMGNKKPTADLNLLQHLENLPVIRITTPVEGER